MKKNFIFNPANIFVIFFLILSDRELLSQEAEDIITDRPDQTESAFTVNKGFIQFEIGGVLESDNDNENINFKTISAPSALIRYGLTKKIELRFGFQYNQFNAKSGTTSIEKVRGFSPIYVGTKFKLLKENKLIPETAFILGIFFPFQSNNIFQPEHISNVFRFTMSNSLSEDLTLSYNLGGAWDGERPNAIGIYTLALGISLSDKLSMFTETYGFYSNGISPDNLIDGGFSFLFSPGLQADISGGIGLNEISPDYFIGAGISLRLPK